MSTARLSLHTSFVFVLSTLMAGCLGNEAVIFVEPTVTAPQVNVISGILGATVTGVCSGANADLVRSLVLIDAPRGKHRGFPGLAAAMAMSAWRSLSFPKDAPVKGLGAQLLRRAASFFDSSSMFVESSEHHLRLLAGHQPGRVRVEPHHFRAAQGRWSQRLLFRHDDDSFLPSERPEITHELPADHFSLLTEEYPLRFLADGIALVLGNADAMSGTSAEEEEVILAVARRFLELSIAGPRGDEVVEELFLRDPQILLFDSYDSDIRGFEAIRTTYGTEYQAITEPRVRMYDPFVRIAPGGQAACVAALIYASLLLRHSRRPVSFPRTRVTWALERHGGLWKVVHVHYSIPVGVPLHAME